jgi:predicted transcriptional regulator
MKPLTQAEEEVMLVLWDKGSCFVRDIVDAYAAPKPAYTTISTIVRILEAKGFVTHQAFGKSHRYASAISKEDYSNQQLNRMVEGYFDGSPSNLLSFFMKHKKMSTNDIENLLNQLKNNHE